MSTGPRRDVLSFVRRSTRMNDSQARAWERHAPQFVVEVPSGVVSTSVAPDARVDWDEVFGRRAPRVVEVGSGSGETLVTVAAARPDHDFVAFEVFRPGVASTLGRIAREGLDNVRLVLADGAQGLSILFGDGDLAEVWTYFADPWHKTRHHKRRLVNPPFADAVARTLAPGGLWRLATDHEDYALHQRAVLDQHPAFVNEFDGWAPRDPERPVSKYEQRGIDAGRTVHDLRYRRVP